MKTVRYGSVRIEVRKLGHAGGNGYWQFRYYDAQRVLHRVTRARKSEAIDEAMRIARRLSGEAAAWEDLPEDLRREALAIIQEGATAGELRQWRQDRAKVRRTVDEMVESFLKHRKAARAGYSRHAEDVRRVLEKVGSDFTGFPMREVDRADLQAWIDGLGVGAKRTRDIRSMVVALWEWARLEGEVDSPTAAERLAKVKLAPTGAIRIFEPDEMRFVVGVVAGEYLPWVVMAGFSGLRSEEIRARNQRAKPPLDWSHVGTDYIEVPAVISKVRRRRLVPIHPTLKAWLEVIDRPKRGPIIPGSPSSWQIGKLSKALDERFDRQEGWPANVLRHSFGSYQAATTGDLPSLSVEMGNSEAIIRRHYQEATTKEAAESYFAVRPA